MVGKVRGTDFRYTYEVGGGGDGVDSDDWVSDCGVAPGYGRCGASMEGLLVSRSSNRIPPNEC
jgi:hypothetical protein